MVSYVLLPSFQSIFCYIIKTRRIIYLYPNVAILSHSNSLLCTSVVDLVTLLSVISVSPLSIFPQSLALQIKPCFFLLLLLHHFLHFSLQILQLHTVKHYIKELFSHYRGKNENIITSYCKHFHWSQPGLLFLMLVVN